MFSVITKRTFALIYLIFNNAHVNKCEAISRGLLAFCCPKSHFTNCYPFSMVSSSQHYMVHFHHFNLGIMSEPKSILGGHSLSLKSSDIVRSPYITLGFLMKSAFTLDFPFVPTDQIKKLNISRLQIVDIEGWWIICI